MEVNYFQPSEMDAFASCTSSTINPKKFILSSLFHENLGQINLAVININSAAYYVVNKIER